MRKIKLTRGYTTLVDERDYENLRLFKWYAKTFPAGVYAARNDNPGDKQITILMHRQILTAKAGEYVDHIDHDTLDNRRENLRICTNAENCRNSKKRRASYATSKFKGVHWCKSREAWIAKIRAGGDIIHIGCFASEVDAARAYDAKAKELHREFALLNFPDKP